MTKYFVMLYHPDAVTPVLMLDEKDEMALYDTAEEAAEVAKHSFLGAATSYEVYAFPPED